MLRSFIHRLIAFSFPVMLIVGFVQKRADAISLVGISESDTSLKAQFSLDGVKSGNYEAFRQPSQWWNIEIRSGTSYNPGLPPLDYTFLFFWHKPEIGPAFFLGSGSAPQNGVNGGQTFPCNSYYDPYCDTLAFSFHSNPDGGPDIVDLTGERIYNDVPEPTTALGSGLAILAGAFLRRRILATNRTSKVRLKKEVKV
jgi:PEP-CTERM motif